MSSAARSGQGFGANIDERRVRVFVVEPYFSGSHRAWAEGLAHHSEHEVHLITHEGAFWRWRLRGASVTVAEQTAALIARVGPPDVLLVSDFVNLPAYLGLVRRTIGDPGVGLYLHENQLSYPLGPNQQPDEALSLVNWVSMVVADQVFVNSQFHHRELFEELPKLLNRAPDQNHQHLLDGVAAKTSVLPIGIDLADVRSRPDEPAGTEPPLVLWAHRWDHDKNPRGVFRALYCLAERGVPFRLAIVGANERVDPQEFHEVRERLADRIDHCGYLERAAYVELLAKTDVVVSAAHHEFFGIAMVEAIVAGAVPVLPDRLSYPEIVPAEFHDAALYTGGQLTARLDDVLNNLSSYRARTEGLSERLRRYDWATVAPQYDAAFDRLHSRGSTQ
ncbi:MAG: DUF3524 domain-containing protein [Acidimicrobiales bacterium]